MNVWKTYEGNENANYLDSRRIAVVISSVIYLSSFVLLLWGHVASAWVLAFMGSISLAFAVYTDSGTDDIGPDRDMAEIEDSSGWEAEETRETELLPEQEREDEESRESVHKTMDETDLDSLFEEYFRKSEEDISQVLEEYSFSNVRICPECGAEFEADRVRCPSCGCNLEDPGIIGKTLLVPGTSTFMLNFETGNAVMLDELGDEIARLSIGGGEI